jgi:molybdate transport system substrate-binding protein
VLLLAILLVAVACGGGKKDGADLPEFTTTTFPTNQVSGDLKVYADASLTEVLTALGQAFEKKNPNAKVVSNFRFADSSTLAQEITAGAPADVVAADDANMAKVISADKVGDAVPLARNVLTLVVKPGNPKAITGLADLAKPGVTYAVCAPELPCGALPAAALRKANVSVAPTAKDTDAKAVVARVARGEVDAGIVFVADLKAAGDPAQRVDIDIAADSDLQANYQIAESKQTSNRKAAEAWVKFVRSDDALQVFADYAFGTQ